MKFKHLICTVMAVLMMVPSMAFAAGKLSYDENFYVAGDYMTYAYGFAKVENVGDKPIMVNACLLEVFDADGSPITSKDYFSKHAEYLQPGEYTYVKVYDSIDGDSVGLVDDYMLTITGKSDNSMITKRLPTEQYYSEDSNGWWTDHYIYVKVTNDTDEPIYDVAVVAAMYDVDGNIIAIQDDRLYSIAIDAGSSVVFRMSVDSGMISYCQNNGIVIGDVDAVAYVNVDNPVAE